MNDFSTGRFFAGSRQWERMASRLRAWENRAMTRILIGLAAAAALAAQTWQDPAKHQVQMVTVAEGVQLEVLDFGGTGKPLVLLAGYFSGHVYDEFAPKLTDTFHVYAISRRGYGASTRPVNGYKADERAADLKAALDALKLQAPVLAGHSFGGEDMTTLASIWPDRVSALVYLNSAEDPTLGMADYGLKPVDGRKLPASMRTPPKPDLSSFAAYRAWQLKAQGISFPEAELRNVFKVKPDGTLGPGGYSADIRQDIFDGRKKPEYEKIKVPVLAIYATPMTMDEQVKKFQPVTPEEKETMQARYDSDMTIHNRHRDDLKKGVPGAKVIDIAGANFYVFASHGDQVAGEIKAFAGK